MRMYNLNQLKTCCQSMRGHNELNNKIIVSRDKLNTQVTQY